MQMGWRRARTRRILGVGHRRWERGRALKIGGRSRSGDAFDPESGWAGDTWGWFGRQLPGLFDGACWGTVTLMTRVRNQSQATDRRGKQHDPMRAPTQVPLLALVLHWLLNPPEPLWANQLQDGAALVQP